MRLGLLFNKADYDNTATNNKTILAVEIVDPTRTDVSTPEVFDDPIQEGVQYIKIFNDLSYMSLAHRQTVISNYSDCYFDKNNGRVVINYTSPTNRALTTFDRKYPMLSDQYLVAFV